MTATAAAATSHVPSIPRKTNLTNDVPMTEAPTVFPQNLDKQELEEIVKAKCKLHNTRGNDPDEPYQPTSINSPPPFGFCDKPPSAYSSSSSSSSSNSSNDSDVSSSSSSSRDSSSDYSDKGNALKDDREVTKGTFGVMDATQNCREIRIVLPKIDSLFKIQPKSDNSLITNRKQTTNKRYTRNQLRAAAAAKDTVMTNAAPAAAETKAAQTEAAPTTAAAIAAPVASTTKAAAKRAAKAEAALTTAAAMAAPVASTTKAAAKRAARAEAAEQAATMALAEETTTLFDSPIEQLQLLNNEHEPLQNDLPPLLPLIEPDDNLPGNDQLTLPHLELQQRIINDGLITVAAVKDAQSMDPFCSPRLEKLAAGQNVARFAQMDGFLVRTGDNKQPRICLPESLYDHIFFNQHHTLIGAHRSANQIALTLAATYYTPNMAVILQKLAAKCYFCTTNTPNSKTPHPLHSDIMASKPRELWSFDILMGIGTTTKNKYNMVALYVDNFSLYTVLVPLKSKDTESILDSFKTHIVQPFTAPYALRSDRETGLIKSLKVQEFAVAHGIHLIPTAPYSSFSNGLAETRIKTVKSLIRCTVKARPQFEWDEQLCLVQLAINQSKSKYGYSPEELHFGFANERPDDPLKIRDTPLDESQYMVNATINLKKAFKHVQNERAKARFNTEKLNNAKKRTRSFQVGQLVYVTTQTISDKSGLVAKRKGPFLIEEISGHSQTARLKDVANGTYTKQHFTHMLPLLDTKMPPHLNTGWDDALKAFQSQHPDPFIQL